MKHVHHAISIVYDVSHSRKSGAGRLWFSGVALGEPLSSEVCFGRSVKPREGPPHKKKGRGFSHDPSLQNVLFFQPPTIYQNLSNRSDLSLATLQPVRAAFRLRTSSAHLSGVVLFLFRKEVIQPQVLLRLPCYDFTPIMSHTLGACLLAVSVATSSTAHFRDVTGGVYKARERIHGVDLIRHY